MSKHTRGPWVKTRDFKLDADRFGLGVQQRVSTIEAEPGFKIADVFDTAFPDMNEANARLIAAAPEMLEALELAVLIFGDYEGKYQATINAMKDAIKKAKGDL